MNDVQNQRLPLLTEEQQKYIAWLLTSRRSGDDDMRVAGVLSEARVDLNPHQVEAALFALKSPFSKGVVLADEVGLGKTIEAGIVISQYWAEQKRRILIIVPATLRRQWSTEMEEKFFLKSEILERGSLISPDIILRKHNLFIVLFSMLPNMLTCYRKPTGTWWLSTRPTNCAMSIKTLLPQHVASAMPSVIIRNCC
jgi:hypothetical protein